LARYEFDKCVIFHGQECADDGSADWGAHFVRLALTNSTTVTATRDTSSAFDCTAKYELVEYYGGVIRSIQRGVTTGATNAITPVTNLARTNLDSLGASYVGASNINVLSAGGSMYMSADDEITVSGGFNFGYQVVEWR
jgi:hypothetical protein